MTRHEFERDEVLITDVREWFKNNSQKEIHKTYYADCPSYAIFVLLMFFNAFYFADIPGDFDLNLMFRNTYISPAIGTTTYPCQTFEEIYSIADVYAYLSSPLFSNHYTSCTSGQCTVAEYNVVEGSVMLRQQRVKPNSGCADNDADVNCYTYLSDETEDTAPFTGTTSSTVYTYTANTHSADIIGQIPRANSQSQVYPNGGYVQLFAEADSATFATALATLQSDNWIGPATRSLIISINLYNPGYDKYVNGDILIEFSPSGAIYTSYNVYALDITRTVNEDWWAEVTCWVLQFLFLWFFLIKHVRHLVRVWRWETERIHTERRQTKLQHQHQDSEVGSPTLSVISGVLHNLKFWGTYEIVFLIMWYVTFIIVIWAYESEASVSSSLSADNQLYLSQAAQNNQIRNYILGTSVFLTVVRAIRFCYVSKRLTLLIDALAHGASDLLAFIVLFFFVFAAFATMAHVVFGADTAIFATFSTTMGTQIGMLFGHVQVRSLQEINKYMGPIYFYSFLFIMSLILMNAFIGIIAYSLFEEKRKKVVQSTVSGDLGALFHTIKARANATIKGGCRANCKDFCKYLKKLVVYFVCGTFEQEKHLLFMNTPLLLEILNSAELRTQEKDPSAQITIGQHAFSMILQSNLTYNGRDRLEAEAARDLIENTWRKIVEWVVLECEVPKTLDQLSEYQTLNAMYHNVDNLQKRMLSELSVLRASQREVLRSVHTVEGKVLAGDGSLESQDQAHTHERREAFTELFGALDDKMFQRQELHLDTHHLTQILHSFNVSLLAGRIAHDEENGETVGVALTTLTNRAQDLELVVTVSSIELQAISTIPLYRDRVFCQITINHHNETNIPTKIIRRTVSQSADADERGRARGEIPSHLAVSNHVFSFVDEYHNLDLQGATQVDLEFAVFHEVPGIRNVEVCRVESGITLQEPMLHPKNETLDMMVATSTAAGGKTKRGQINVSYHLRTPTNKKEK
eukprot:TRINITY_DN8635_c0_g1_i3.p1 TRINITY_DN8635_c0_g1~~TRINITY_DN8635_c0_g1_i3.p1  ORF type:complete len:975 (-),score=212.84 TRINITY_DN8635_c0_g1_i3:92-3016(-)